MDEYLPYAVLVLLTYCHPPPSLALRVSDPGIPKQGISGFGNQASLCIFFFFLIQILPLFFFFLFLLHYFPFFFLVLKQSSTWFLKAGKHIVLFLSRLCNNQRDKKATDSDSFKVVHIFQLTSDHQPAKPRRLD